MSKERMNQADDQVLEVVNGNHRERVEEVQQDPDQRTISPFWKAVCEIAPAVLVVIVVCVLYLNEHVSAELYTTIYSAGLVYLGWRANNAHRLYRRNRRKA